MGEILFRDNYIVIEKEGTLLKITSLTKRDSILRINVVEKSLCSSEENGILVIKWEEDLKSTSVIKESLSARTSCNERKISYDMKERKIAFQKETILVRDQNSLDRKLCEVSVYDHTLKLEERYYGAKPTFYSKVSKICSIQDGRSYMVCITSLAILELWEDVVKVYSLFHPLLMFRGVHSYNQVSKKVGDSTFFHPYYVLTFAKKKIVLNVNTMKYIALSCHQIFPICNDLHYKYYIFEEEYIIPACAIKSYILIDKVLYDCNFKIAAVIGRQSFSRSYVDKFDVLDVFENLISIKDDRGFLCIMKIGDELNNIKEIPYHYRLGDESFFLKVSSNKVDYIDLKTGKFILALSYLKRKYERETKKSWGKDDEDDINYFFGGKPIYGDEGYYNIDDASYREAFDDDAEAYWNID